MKQILRIGFTIVLIILIQGCASSAFKDARESDTITSYRSFLAEHGDSDYAGKARSLLNQRLAEKRDWDAYSSAKRGGTIKSFDNYLANFPNGRYRKSIKDLKSKRIKTNKLDVIYSRIMQYNTIRKIIHALILARNNFSDKYFFDGYIKGKGIDYLDDIYFAKQNLVLVSDVFLDSVDLLFVDIDKYGLYASVVNKGEPLYEIGSKKYRGLASHRNIRNTPSRLDAEKAEGIEIFGELSAQMEQNNQRVSDLITKTPTSYLPTTYKKCTLAKTYTQASGAIVDFIEEYPIASAVIAVGAASMLSNNSSSSSSYSSSSSSNSGLFSCAGQSMASHLAENPVASGVISEAVRSSIENDEFSVYGATANSAKSYFTNRLREEGNSDAANLVEAGDFIWCLVNSN